MIVLILIVGQSILKQEHDFNFIRQLFLDQSYSLVITEGKNFLNRYPESELADDVLYLDAESNFRLKNYRRAIKQFSRYLDASLDTDLHDDAQIRIIQANFVLGNDNEVIRLVNRFPIRSSLYPKSLYLKGETYYRQNLYKDALDCYITALKDNPDVSLKVSILYSIAYANFRLKLYQRAIKYCDRLIKKFPDYDLSREANFLKARSLVNLGRKKEALDYLEFISEQDEDIAVEAKIMAADICLEANDFDQAQILYQRVIRYYPLHTGLRRAYLGLGRVALHKGDYQKATSIYETFIDSFPRSTLRQVVEHELGLAYLGSGNYPLARKWLAKSNDNYHIGLSYFEEGDYRNAIRYLSTLEATSKIERLLGESYYNLGDYEQGISHYLNAGAIIDAARGYLAQKRNDKALNLLAQAEDYQAMLFRAEIQYDNGNHEGALADYLKTYALKKKPEPLYGAGWSSYMLKDYQSAIKYFAMVIKQFPDWEMVSDALLTLGDCYLNIKEYNQAILTYEKISKDAQEYEEAVFRSGLAHLRNHNYRRAAFSFAKLKGEEAIYMLGYSCFQLGNYERAVEILSKIDEDSKYYLSARQTIGDCYYNLNADNQALDTYLEIYEQADSSLAINSALDGIRWIYERRGESAVYANLLDSLITTEGRNWLIPELRFRLAKKLIKKDTSNAFRNLHLVIDDAQSDSLRGKALLLLTTGMLDLGMVDSTIIYSKRLMEIGGHHNRGVILLARGLYDNEDYTGMIAVLRRMPRSVEKYYWLAMANHSLRKISSAIMNYKKVLEIETEGALAGATYLQLAKIRIEEHDYDRSIDLLKNSITNATDSLAAHAQLLVGDVYMKKGQYQNAIIEYRRLEYLFPSFTHLNARALVSIGECYEKQRKWDEAKRTFQMVKRRYPKTEWERIADEHLADIDS